MKYSNISKVLFLSFLITVKAIPIQTTKTLPLLSTRTRGTLDEYKKVNPKSIYTPPKLNEKLCTEIGGVYENDKCTINPKKSNIEYSSVKTTTKNEDTIINDITTKIVPTRTRLEKTIPTEYSNIYITASGYVYEYPPKYITVTNMKNLCYIRSGEYDSRRRACKYTIDNTSTRSLPPKIVPTLSSSLAEISTTKQVFITDLEKHCSKHGAVYIPSENNCRRLPKTVSISQPYYRNTKNVPGYYTMSGYRYDLPPKYPMTNMRRVCRDKNGEYDYLLGVCKYPIESNIPSSTVTKNTMTVVKSTTINYTNITSSPFYETATSFSVKALPSNILTTTQIVDSSQYACTMPDGNIVRGTGDCKSIHRTTRTTTTTTDTHIITNAKALPSPFDIQELCSMYDAYYDPVKNGCSSKVPETTVTFSTMDISSSTFTEEPIQEPTPYINECAKEWDQCGGLEYDGPNCCQSGFVCEIFNEYYSQCIKKY